MKERVRIDATTGSLTKSAWALAWPVILANFIQVIYNFADTFWVSKLDDSTEGIAAVTVAFSIMFLLIALANGLSVAAGTLSAQYFGAGEYERIEVVTYTALVILTLLSAIVTGFGIIFSEKLLILLNTPKNVMPYAIDYFRIIMGGTVFMFAFFLLSGILRGVGDTFTPMVVGIVSGILNVILDPLLMFGVGPFPKMGIAGAAYATVISQGIVAIYLLYTMFFGKHHFKLSLKKFHVDWGIAKQMLNLGLPAGATQIIISMGAVALIGRVNEFGDVATAAHGLGHRLDSVIFMPAMALNQAAAVMVGQNLGAGNRERARQSGAITLKMVFLILIGLSIFLFIFPELFLKIFSQDQEVIRLGVDYIRFLSIGYAFLGCRIVMNGAFQGAGASFTALIFSIISLWGIRIPMAYLLSFTSLGVSGLWLGIGISYIVSTLIMYYWFHKGDWLDKSVVNS